MKKTYIVALCLLLLFPFFSHSAAQAADTKSGSISIPVSTGLIGSDNSAKTFYLDLPSGVTSSAIKTGTFKYSGNNSVIGAISIENGKIKLTLKGNEKIETLSVKGTDGAYSKNFITTPGNSIWRYADGRRWQINDYDEKLDVNKSYNVNAEDSLTPSDAPPKRVVSTKSVPVDPGQATWFKNGVDTVPYSSIIQSSIQLNPLSLEGDSGKVGTKNGKFIITYTVPSSLVRPEQVSDGFDKGQWVEGRLYYVRLPYYFTANAKVSSYSYAGSVTFDYSLPTEPTLDGRLTVVSPNPNPTMNTGADVPVTLKVSGELLSYTDSSNIMEWVFYAKETGASEASTKKDGTKVLTSSRAFDNLIIPKAKITGDEFEQEYTVTVTVRFLKPVITPAGSITSLSKTMKATVGVYKNPTVGQDQPSGGNKPPVAVLDVPEEVMAGEEFLAYGKDSYDPDGTIVNYKFTAQGSKASISGSYGYTWYSLDALGKHTVILKVTDNDGLSATTSAKVEVIKPIPKAVINIGGTKKENRKVIISNKSTSPEHYPIDDSKTQFTLAAVSGGTNADIKYSGSLSGFNEKDVLFKKAGTYKATITVTNTAGFSDSTSITFDIIPDEAPTVYISVPPKVYRDPEDGNRASVTLTDMSISTDYDWIAHRLWQYRYDSNNDGNFTDESWVTISDQNESDPVFKPSKVGRYEIKLTVTEEFDQPTIDAFVTVADRRSSDSYTDSLKQPLIERVMEVANRAPIVDWSW